MLLHVRVGNLRVRGWFGVVENLAVSVLFGTKFINRFIRGLFPPERKIFPFHSKPVAIMASFHEAVNAVQDASASGDVTVDGNPVLFRVARQTRLAPMSETPVLVATSGSGLMTIEGHPNLAKRGVALTASVVIDAVAGQLFYVLVASFSMEWEHIPKHMPIAIGDEMPQCVVHVTGDERLLTAGDVE